MVKEIFLDMCQLIDVLKRIIDIFDDFNAFSHLKAMCAIDDIETDDGYFGHVE